DHHQDAEGDLEVERLLALLVDEGIHVLLHLPDDQRAQHVADHRRQEPEERRVVAEHCPAPRLRRGLWNRQLFIHGLLPVQSASAACCRANNSFMPPCARASIALSSSGWKGAPSAVPCTS